MTLHHMRCTLLLRNVILVVPRRYPGWTTGKMSDEYYKYQDTCLLPVQTDFRWKVNTKEVVENEVTAQRVAKFSSLYAWQRNQPREKEFVLHDGPIYANGKPHIGHAANKILKDITLRHKLLQGYKVHFIPGWDCHGLPIELKAFEGKDKTSRNVSSLTPLELRMTARNFAEETIKLQTKSFIRWGLLADWKNVYYTFDSKYVAKQLRLFKEIFCKGYVYSDYLPVNFSPSSGTVLSDVEVEYKLKKSWHIYFAVPAINVPEELKGYLLQHNLHTLYLPAFNTTPWTLPFNKAMCFAPDQIYGIYHADFNGRQIALLFAQEIEENLKVLDCCDIRKLGVIEGTKLLGLSYRHPVSNAENPVLPGTHVTMDKGSGFVHVAPAHGVEDFLLGQKYGLSLECSVDENGRYKSDVGEALAGKEVLYDGTDTVIQMLESNDGPAGPSLLLNKKKDMHSYPFDCRTQKPIIVCASKQWFIRLDELKAKALEVLNNISTTPDAVKNLMVDRLKDRSYWCISRQRKWGVPLPAFYDRETDEPIISVGIIEHAAAVIEKQGCDAWWTLSEEELLPSDYVNSMARAGKKLPRKGTDIMDIWFDSGSTWHCILDGKIADIYLEGVDQISAWFQTSLLTSVAVNDVAPYRHVMVHGFAVDGKGQKMSKSLGNVIDPHNITDGSNSNKGMPVFGADLLRWWAANQSSGLDNMLISQEILNNLKLRMRKLRGAFAFLLSNLSDFDPQKNSIPISHQKIMDCYLLHRLHTYLTRVWNNYNSYHYATVTTATDNFVAELHGYFECIKDRLYCEPCDSIQRRSAQTVLHIVLNQLLLAVGPILPHTVEEVASKHPSRKGWIVFQEVTEPPPMSWKQDNLAATVTKCSDVRLKLMHELTELKNPNPLSFYVKIEAGGDTLRALQLLHPGEDIYQSDLTELLHVSAVTLRDTKGEGFNLEILKSECGRCPRCRKFSAPEGEALCNRCTNVISELSKQ